MLVQEIANRGKSDKIVFGGKHQVTYGELQEKVRQYRDYFYRQGVRPGDRVGLFSRNSPEFVYSYLAIVSLRAVAVPLNFQLAAPEIAYIVQDAGMRTLVTMARLDLAEGRAAYGYAEPLNQLVIAEFAAHLPPAAAEPPPGIGTADEDEVCVFLYTSGTTGRPKGAMLSHGNLVSAVQSFTAKLPVAAEDTVLCVLPMYHGFSWTCPVLGSLMQGATIVIADVFSKEIVATVRDSAVTIVYAIPAMYAMLVNWAEPEDFRAVKLFASGGASLPEALLAKFAAKFGANIYEGYGLSEAAPCVAFNPPAKTKPGSIGQALPGNEVRVADERGNALPPGVCGELQVRGPNVMKGYHDRPAETAAAIVDGWLRTGDVAYVDEEGYFFIKDRLKDMIVISGENVYPREVEEVLCAYPPVAEAAVIGIDDRVRGETVAAALVLREGAALDEKALRRFLRKNLAAYKVPKVFAAVAALPKNSLGKVLKPALRQQAAEIFARGGGKG
jgi:long-chain acyl-CoA synthetase